MVIEDMQGEVKEAAFAQPVTEEVKGVYLLSLPVHNTTGKAKPDFSWERTTKQ